MRFRLKCVTYLVISVCLCAVCYFMINESISPNNMTNSEINNAIEEDPVMLLRRKRYEAAMNRPSREGPGENGAAVVLTPDEQKVADTLFKAAAFNVFASDKIAMDRSIPDTRIPE